METTTETVVVQVKADGEWRDYSRCTPEQAEVFLKERWLYRDAWRAVDWITKRPLSAVDLDERIDRGYFDGTRKCDCHAYAGTHNRQRYCAELTLPQDQDQAA